VDEILRKLPEDLAEEIRKAAEGVTACSGTAGPEEIHLTAGRPVRLKQAGRSLELPYTMTQSRLERIFAGLLDHSVYARQEELQKGFLTVKGGSRVGVCGRTVVENGKVVTIREISSLNIRRAREFPGMGKEAAAAISEPGGRPYNTLILSPPGGGKTTALRDIIRLLSDSGRRVGVIDERGELSERANDLGRCSDVISGLDKLTGALLLLRSMTPEIIAADEITAPVDVSAVEEIFGCGTGILATAHARDLGDLAGRESYRRILDKGIFRNAVLIRMRDGSRHYEIRKLA